MCRVITLPEYNKGDLFRENKNKIGKNWIVSVIRNKVWNKTKDRNTVKQAMDTVLSHALNTKDQNKMSNEHSIQRQETFTVTRQFENKNMTNKENIYESKIGWD